MLTSSLVQTAPRMKIDQPASLSPRREAHFSCLPRASQQGHRQQRWTLAVGAMLIAAAEQTQGLRALPKPFVYQRGLADYYVEYELFAYMDHPLNRVPVLSALHANIQDQFNTYGVQIMSPHFVVQPKDAVLVPTDGWYAAPAEPKQ